MSEHPRKSLPHLRVSQSLLAALGLVAPALALAGPECVHPDGARSFGVMGDVNDTGLVNVADALCSTMSALVALASPGAPSWPACVQVHPTLLDLDCDGAVTIGDTQLVIWLAISGALPPDIGTGPGGCPAQCASGGGQVQTCEGETFVFEGSLYIDAMNPPPENYECIENITGDLELGATAPSLLFDALAEVGGDVTFDGFAAGGARTLSAPSLGYIGGKLTLDGMGAVILSLEQLGAVEAGLEITGASAPLAFSAPALEYLGGALAVTENLASVTLSFGSGAYIGGATDILANQGAVSLALPDSPYLGGPARVSSNQAAVVITTDTWPYVEGHLLVDGNAAAVEIALGEQPYIEGDLRLEDNTAAVTIDLDGSVYVQGDLTAIGNEAPVAVSLGGYAYIEANLRVEDNDAGVSLTLLGYLYVEGNTRVEGNIGPASAPVELSVGSYYYAQGDLTVADNGVPVAIYVQGYHYAQGATSITGNAEGFDLDVGDYYYAQGHLLATGNDGLVRIRVAEGFTSEGGGVPALPATFSANGALLLEVGDGAAFLQGLSIADTAEVELDFGGGGVAPEGAVEIVACGDLALSWTGTVHFIDSLALEANTISALAMPNVQLVRAFRFEDNAGVTSLDGVSVQTLGLELAAGSLAIRGNTHLASVVGLVGGVDVAGASLAITGNPQLQAVALPGVESLDIAELEDNASLATLNLSGLEAVTTLALVNNPALTAAGLNLSALATGSLAASENLSLSACTLLSIANDQLGMAATYADFQSNLDDAPCP